LQEKIRKTKKNFSKSSSHFDHKTIVLHINKVMKSSVFALLSFFGLLVGLLHGQMATSGQQALSTVQNLDLDAYLGRWYMMYTSQVPLNTYLKGATCVVEDHKLIIDRLSTDNKPIVAEFNIVISFKLESFLTLLSFVVSPLLQPG
jgi:hypothetical protein